jgi:exosortase/archaeosortase family protein
MSTGLSRQTKFFFLKVLAIYAVWYLVYEVWLLPAGHVDRWVAENLVSVGAGLLSTLGFSVDHFGRVLAVGLNPGIEVANGCNGIAAMGLFVGFIVAYPGKQRYRWPFLLLGIGVIYLVNLGRIVTLALTQEYWPAFFEITHDYSTTTIFYLVIFGLWVIWANAAD